MKRFEKVDGHCMRHHVVRYRAADERSPLESCRYQSCRAATRSTHISEGLAKKETAVEICPKLPDFPLHNTNLPCPCLSSFTERNLTTLKLGTNKWKESPIEMILKPQRESRPSHPPVGRDRVPQHHEYISRLGLIFQNRLAVTLLTVIAFIDAGGLRP